MSSISSEKTPFKKPKILTLPKHQKNMNQELLNIIENLKEENSQLKEALIELEKDSKEKDQSIEECQKIINKLKEEYEKVVREFEFIEKAYNDLIEESNRKTLIISEPKITRSVISLINTNKSENKKAIYKENVNNGKMVGSIRSRPVFCHCTGKGLATHFFQLQNRIQLNGCDAQNQNLLQFPLHLSSSESRRRTPLPAVQLLRVIFPVKFLPALRKICIS